MNLWLTNYWIILLEAQQRAFWIRSQIQCIGLNFIAMMVTTQIRLSYTYPSHFKIFIQEFWKGKVEQNPVQPVFQHFFKTQKQTQEQGFFASSHIVNVPLNSWFLHEILRDHLFQCFSNFNWRILILTEGLRIDLLLQLAIFYQVTKEVNLDFFLLLLFFSCPQFFLVACGQT